MAELDFVAPTGGLAAKQAGAAAVPASLYDVWGAMAGQAIVDDGLMPRAARQIIDDFSTPPPATPPTFSLPTEGSMEGAYVPDSTPPAADTLSAKDATERFGIPGRLKFDAPVSETVARSLLEHKREQIAREAIIERRTESVLTGAVAQFGIGMIAGFLDPIQLGSAFIPFVPEAQYAAALAARSTVLGRAGVRAGAGAIEGFGGAALLTPLQVALDLRDQNDVTMTSVMYQLAMGTALGGGAHVALGAARDALGAYKDRLARRMEAASPEVRAEALQAAVASVAETGRAADLAPLLDIVAPDGPHTPTPAERAARVGVDDPNVPPAEVPRTIDAAVRIEGASHDALIAAARDPALRAATEDALLLRRSLADAGATPHGTEAGGGAPPARDAGDQAGDAGRAPVGSGGDGRVTGVPAFVPADAGSPVAGRAQATPEGAAGAAARPDVRSPLERTGAEGGAVPERPAGRDADADGVGTPVTAASPEVARQDVLEARGAPVPGVLADVARAGHTEQVARRTIDDMDRLTSLGMSQAEKDLAASLVAKGHTPSDAVEAVMNTRPGAMPQAARDEALRQYAATAAQRDAERFDTPEIKETQRQQAEVIAAAPKVEADVRADPSAALKEAQSAAAIAVSEMERKAADGIITHEELREVKEMIESLRGDAESEARMYEAAMSCMISGGL